MGFSASAKADRLTPRAWAALLLTAIAVAALPAGSTAHPHRADGTSRAADRTARTAANGWTTVERRIVGGDRKQRFSALTFGPGEPHLTRELADSRPVAQPGREARRISLAYFGQLTDIQLADEESPARVEFLDAAHAATQSAWRPGEALHPFAFDLAIQLMNEFTDASPVPQGDGSRAPMGFALLTGDLADNQHFNETLWIRQLIEGGQELNPNTGIAPPYPATRAGCALAQAALDPQEGSRYTGVQDYDDYFQDDAYYDPDKPAGQYATLRWPTYPGLMDRAQQVKFVTTGLKVKTYVSNGNHDTLVQGNEDAIRAYEDIALGCEKPLAPAPGPRPPGLDVASLLNPSRKMFVPPDPNRWFVNKPQFKEVYMQGRQADGHGFAFVDPAENKASRNSAAYFAWDPPEAPGFRFISIDTVSEGGVVERSSSGNIDDPQFKWLEAQLKAASEAGKLIVVFGHHPVVSLTSDIPDEAAAPCSRDEEHGHDHNPGCDLHPRDSRPVHLGADFVALLHKYPHAIAYVAGHTHENRVTPYSRPAGGGWWGIETAAGADWPQQNRLIEVMDNRDGTLSIFGTLLDSTAPPEIPASGTGAAAFGVSELASIDRALTYNDPQAGAPIGEGRPADRNVELLLPDPSGGRVGDGPPPDLPPITTATLDPPAPDGGAGWYRSAVTVTLDASDDRGGFTTEYRLDDGDWQPYHAPFTVAADGPHTVTYRSTDAAGNREAPKSRSFRIDRTAPVTEATLDPPQPDSATKEGWYSSAVTVTLASGDAASGVATTRYRLDGAGERPYSEAFQVDGGGEHTVVYRSTDHAGNVEEERTVSFKIDRPPERPPGSSGPSVFDRPPAAPILGTLERGLARRAGPRFLISRRAIALTRRGIARVAVSCRQRPRCRGALALRARARSQRDGRLRSVFLGRRSFRVRGMRRSVVRVRLPARGRTLLARRKRTRVRATARVARPTGTPWTARSSFRLSRPR